MAKGGALAVLIAAALALGAGGCGGGGVAKGATVTVYADAPLCAGAGRGADARRATEDSASVAYIESPSRPSFSRPILESAGVAWISSSSGAAGMARLMHAIQGADPGSLRESVREALHETG